MQEVCCRSAMTSADALLNGVSMNDLVRCYTVSVETEGGLASCDLTGIIMTLNNMPQRTLDWATSWDVARAQIERAAPR